MPLRSGGPAPYGPPAAVLAVIKGFRDRGLATPFSPEVLLRAGINESIIPRTLKSLEALDLIDKEGTPTQQMEGLRRATTEDFPARLEEVVRLAYAEVFQFANPTTDDLTRVADAFRAYEPVGQRGRMVTLFMGLCDAAGITAKKAAATAAITAPARRPARFFRTESQRRPASVGPQARVRNGDGGLIPAPLTGILAGLPQEGEGWTKARRDAFIAAFGSVLDFCYPITGSRSTPAPVEEGADDYEDSAV
jgi:hypothetical protein